MNLQNLHYRHRFVMKEISGDSIINKNVSQKYSLCSWCLWINLRKGKKIVCSPKLSDQVWGPPSHLFNSYRGSRSGV